MSDESGAEGLSFKEELTAALKADAAPDAETAPEPEEIPDGQSLADVEEADELEEQEPVDTGEPEEAVDLDELPEGWSKKDKAIFAMVPDEAREVILRREKERNRGLQKKTEELADFRKTYEPIDKALGQFIKGLPEDQRAPYIGGLIQTDSMFRRDPAQYVRSVVEMARLNPSELFPDKKGNGEDKTGVEFRDPLQDEIDRLNDKIKSLESGQAQQQQYLGQQEKTAIQQTIDAFKNEKDSGGNLVHPHFEAVRRTMGNLIDRGEAADFQDAYDKAVLLKPDLRDEWITAQYKQRENADLMRRKKRVAQAKKAARTNIPSRMATEPDSGPSLSFAEELRQNLENAMRGGP